jgi:hypothetical protein
VPAGLVHVAKIPAVGLEGPVLLHSLSAEKQGESDDEKQAKDRR